MWPKQKGLWVVCPLFPCHPGSGVMPVASTWFLLFYGHRALDQWPPWPSALIPYPVLITCSCKDRHIPQHASPAGHLSLQIGFSAPQVAVGHGWRLLRWSVNSSTKSCSWIQTMSLLCVEMEKKNRLVSVFGQNVFVSSFTRETKIYVREMRQKWDFIITCHGWFFQHLRHKVFI